MRRFILDSRSLNHCKSCYRLEWRLVTRLLGLPQDIGLLQRSQIQGVPALWRVQGVLVSVQLGDESDHFRLIG